ncbi:hypothetical protein [Falsiroseomonas sp.]|uniref:hypothetical protein n=1 Tax=Falsiroseomonas sp. TaxID=2870721 RepID=UPI00356B31D3
MNRKVVFVLFAFLGCLFALVAALPSARSGELAAAPPTPDFQVPLAWMAEALAQMPFILPPGR